MDASPPRTRSVFWQVGSSGEADDHAFSALWGAARHLTPHRNASCSEILFRQAERVLAKWPRGAPSASYAGSGGRVGSFPQLVEAEEPGHPPVAVRMSAHLLAAAIVPKLFHRSKRRLRKFFFVGAKVHQVADRDQYLSGQKLLGIGGISI